MSIISRAYYSSDIISDDIGKQLQFSTEFLNTQKVNELPRHRLELLGNSVVLFKHNLTVKGFINGLRMHVKLLIGAQCFPFKHTVALGVAINKSGPDPNKVEIMLPKPIFAH